MARVTWTPTATNHLIEICDDIALHSVASAEGFAARVIDKVELLKKHPELGQEVFYRTTILLRQLVVDRNIIYYRVRGEQVEILAIFDGRRNLPEILRDLFGEQEG